MIITEKEIQDRKIKEEIFNKKNENLKKLEQLFPSVVKDGQVDFMALKEELGEFEEVGNEKYGLNWTGKQQAKKVAQEDIINKTLKYVPEDSKNADTTENLYIEGDNLEVLKLLRQNYYNAIKMIYIDPPYNTGNDFIYNDDYSMSSEESDIQEGNISELDERYTINQKSSNKFHAKWLDMMYPRLKVAKDLLTDDGIVAISIDDNEQANLVNICNEIFGEENFLNCIVVKMSTASGVKLSHRHSKILKTKEYIVVYCKNKKMININPQYIRKNKWDDYYEFYLDNTSENIKDWKVHRLKEYLQSIGINNIDMEDKDFRNFYYENSDRIWQRGRHQGIPEDIFKKSNLNRDKVYEYFDANGKKQYCYRGRRMAFLSNVMHNCILSNGSNIKDIGTLICDFWENISTAALFSEGGVEFPNGKKPLYLLEILINMFSNDTDIILDFFAGSASTAEAVIRGNMENKKNRKFIMVQLDDNLEKSIKSVSGDSKKQMNEMIKFLDSINKKHYLSEIGKERLRIAGENLVKENKDKEGIENLDIGFKVFKVGDTNLRWNNYNNMDVNQISLEEGKMSDKDKIDFMPGTKDIDVVYEILLRQRDIPLSSKVQKLSEIGDRTYIFAEGFVVCLEENITEDLINKLVALNPLPVKFYFRDSAFNDDIDLKDYSIRELEALVAKNTGDDNNSYAVEFI